MTECRFLKLFFFHACVIASGAVYAGNKLEHPESILLKSLQSHADVTIEVLVTPCYSHIEPITTGKSNRYTSFLRYIDDRRHSEVLSAEEGVVEAIGSGRTFGKGSAAFDFRHADGGL